MFCPGQLWSRVRPRNLAEVGVRTVRSLRVTEQFEVSVCLRV